MKTSSFFFPSWMTIQNPHKTPHICQHTLLCRLCLAIVLLGMTVGHYSRLCVGLYCSPVGCFVEWGGIVVMLQAIALCWLWPVGMAGSNMTLWLGHRQREEKERGTASATRIPRVHWFGNGLKYYWIKDSSVQVQV